MKNLILYHANCYDGMWAAWAALQKLGEARCIPAAYNTPIPDEAFEHAREGGNVYIVDFSYPLYALENLRIAIAEGGGTLLVIDHHETAMNQLSSFSDAIFDMDKSGAVLTWEHFHSVIEIAMPPVLSYVQDRDLWQHKLAWTRQVYAAMSNKLYGAKPEELTDRCISEFGLSPYDPELVGSMAEMGIPIFRERMEKVRSLALTDSLLWADLGDGFVPVAQVDRYWSDVCNMLCEIYLDRPYSIAYRQAEDGRFLLDLRSLGYPVNAIAQKMGGGGHLKAAGCPVPADGIELWSTTAMQYIENNKDSVLPQPTAVLTSQGLQVI